MGNAVRLDAHGRRAWQRSRKVILQALACYDRHGKLPKSAWFAFDKKDNARALSKLLEEAVSVLRETRLYDQRRELEELDAQEKNKREELMMHRSESIGFPEKTGWMTATRNDHLSKALRAKNELKKLHQRRNKLVEQMGAQLESMGIELNEDQVQAILLSISGDDVSGLVSLFHNVKQLTVQLQALMGEDEQDAITAKHYYGMYVVLLQILVYAHEKFLDRLDQDFLPKLKRIEEDNDEQRLSTARLLHGATDEKEQEALRANLASQATSEKVVRVYRNFLRHQREMTADTLEGLDRRLEIATNTYRTAEIASNLVTLIRMSIRDLVALQSMRLPELVAFENADLAGKFQAITTRMRQLPR